MNGLQHQRGMGYWGYMFAIICVVVLGKLGYATVPAFIEDRAFDKLLVDKLSTAGNKSADQVLKDVQGQLRMDFSDVKIDEIVEVVNGSPGSIVLKTNYDVRNNLFANVDVAMHFEKEYRQ